MPLSVEPGNLVVRPPRKKNVPQDAGSYFGDKLSEPLAVFRILYDPRMINPYTLGESRGLSHIYTIEDTLLEGYKQYVFEIYRPGKHPIAPRNFTSAEILWDNGLDSEMDALKQLWAAFVLRVDDDKIATFFDEPVTLQTEDFPAYFRGCTENNMRKTKEGIWVADDCKLWADTEKIPPKDYRVMAIGDFVHFLYDEWLGIQRLA